MTDSTDWSFGSHLPMTSRKIVPSHSPVWDRPMLRSVNCVFVCTMRQDKHTGRSEPAPAEVLYRRGRTSTMCTLILTGKVVVLAGRDGQYD